MKAKSYMRVGSGGGDGVRVGQTIGAGREGREPRGLVEEGLSLIHI